MKAKIIYFCFALLSAFTIFAEVYPHHTMEKEKKYLEFLHFCLDETVSVPKDALAIDYDELYLFARQQTVESTYWEGIQRLDKLGLLKLPDTTVLKWMARVKKVEKRNRLIYKKAAWVWNNFMKEGFRSCVLKGQGNALLYPTPMMRTPGDIDIWVEGGDEKVIAYVNSICPGFKASYHHIDFISAGDVPIEVHYRPSWMSNPWHNKRLQEWFEQQAGDCFANKKEEWGFCVPTFEFNVVYLLSHIYSHLIREGVGLRHIVDYYHLLRNHPDGKRPSEKTLRHLGLRKIAGAMMWVLSETLRLDKSLLLCPPDERRGRLLLNEILLGGNFGKFDERAFGGVSDTVVRHNAKTLMRDVRLLRFFHSECVWEPYFRVWHYFWRRRHTEEVKDAKKPHSSE